MGRKRQFLPSQLLLAGIAISAALSAGVSVALAEGGETVLSLVNWLAGSLYLVTYDDIFILGISIALLSLLVFASHRKLDIVFLGDDIARSLGLNLSRVKGTFLLAIGALTTCCMIIIGPLSFVGLIAPHMARSFHQYTAAKQLAIAALLGALIMIIADWVGRTMWFPQQYPAGLLASLLGGAYFIFMLRKK
jgi:iron complex transport system permease protein